MFAAQFRYSFRNGRPKNVIHTPFFTLAYQKNDKQLACAVIISKKIDSRATVRNALKRRFVMSLQSLLTPQNFPYDLVFYGKKPLVELSDEQMKEQLQGIISKLN